jgi:ABC-2 type transport system ATP-binding protein
MASDHASRDASAPAASPPALSVRDLRKTYDTGVQALKGVSL